MRCCNVVNVYLPVCKNQVTNISIKGNIAEKVIYIDDINPEIIYDGEYNVTSSLEDKVLNTHGKYLEKDIKIDKLPINKMTNPSGGITLVIG